MQEKRWQLLQRDASFRRNVMCFVGNLGSKQGN
jgi:hypothetical protein